MQIKLRINGDKKICPNSGTVLSGRSVNNFKICSEREEKVQWTKLNLVSRIQKLRNKED